MPTVDRIKFVWTVDRDGSRHWLAASYSNISGEGVLHLELTPWLPSRAPDSLVKVWPVASVRIGALARFLGSVMAEAHGRLS